MNRPVLIELQSIKLVSWDVDGTLYSIPKLKWRLLCVFLREAAKGRGLAVKRELEALGHYRATVDTARTAGGILDQTGQQQKARQLLLRVEQRWYGPAIHKTGMRAGVAEVLSFLAASHLPQVVISDYEAKYKLEALELDGRFASIYVGERLGFVKPSPKVFERVAADFEIPISSLLHIGDRADRDEAGALAAGCQCLILGRDFGTFSALLEQLNAEARS